MITTVAKPRQELPTPTSRDFVKTNLSTAASQPTLKDSLGGWRTKGLSRIDKR